MNADKSPQRDLREPVTNIYISIMLLVFPLFTGFSGYSNITFSKYLFFVLCTVLWLAVLAALSVAGSLSFPRLRFHHLAALAYAAVCCLSTVFSPHSRESLIGAGRYDGLVTQLLYVGIFLGVSLFARPKKAHFVCLSSSLLLCSAVALVQLFNIDILGLFPGDYSHYDAGIRYSGAFLGTIGNTNVLSAFYCLALPCLFAFPVISEKKAAWLSLISVCPAVFVLIRAEVSGGFVGLLVCLLVAAPLLITDMSRLRRALIAAAAVLVSAAAALAFVPEYSLGNFSWSFRFGTLPLAAIAAAVLFTAAAFILGKLRLSPSSKSLRRFFLLLCVFAVLAALLFVYFSPAEEGTVYEFSQLLHGNIDEKFGSSRILIWRECFALFGERPLLGGGPDTVGLRVDIQFSRFVEETGKTLRSGVDNAHNEYLGCLINTGALGLLSYLTLMFLCLVSWLRSLHRKSLCALGLGCLCYGVQSFFALGLPLVAPLFWISLALIASRDGQHQNPSETPLNEPA